MSKLKSQFLIILNHTSSLHQIKSISQLSRAMWWQGVPKLIPLILIMSSQATGIIAEKLNIPWYLHTSKNMIYYCTLNRKSKIAYQTITELFLVKLTHSVSLLFVKERKNRKTGIAKFVFETRKLVFTAQAMQFVIHSHCSPICECKKLGFVRVSYETSPFQTRNFHISRRILLFILIH